MHRTQRVVLTLALALLTCSVPAMAAEMVDNPQYTAWAKHKPGTTVTMKQDMNMGAMAMTSTLVQKLVEVTPDKATLEFTMTMEMAGQKHENTQKQEISSKVEKGKEYAAPGMKASTKETGSEKVEVAGKTYDCKILEFEGEGPQGKAAGKMWQTQDIPGGLAKMDMTMQAPQQGTVKMAVTGMDLK